MQKGFVIIPILIGILVLGGVVGAWYTKIIQIPGFAPPGCSYKQVQCIQAPCDPILICENPSPSPAATQAPQVIPSPSPDETANWKTLKKNGWEAKYPADWYIQGEGSQRSTSILNKADLQKSEVDVVLQGDFPGEVPINFDSFFAPQVGSVVKDGFRTVTTIRKLNIDGYPAVEVLDEDFAPLANETMHYFLDVYVKGPINVSILASSPQYGVDKNAHERFLATYVPIFEKMLTTIKFSK